MVSLSSVQHRFEISCMVIAGGSGKVVGVLTEAPQTQAPSYVFVAPRMIFRTAYPTPVRTGMVICTPAGSVFIVGDNGPSETAQMTLWQSFRLFEATGQYTWRRRSKVLDPVTKLLTDGDEQDLGLLWAAIEPEDRMAVDLKIRTAFAQNRIITGGNLQLDDIVDGQQVTKVDDQLGLRTGVLT